MFYGCKELTEIKGLEEWKTDNVENMRYMFCGCENLKSPNKITFKVASNRCDTYNICNGCNKDFEKKIEIKKPEDKKIARRII